MKGQHEKIIKRPNGDRVKITVSLARMRFDFEWNVDRVESCEKGKRKFHSPEIKDEWSFRTLSMEDRRKVIMEGYLTLASASEIHEAKLELWNKLKPIE